MNISPGLQNTPNISLVVRACPALEPAGPQLLRCAVLVSAPATEQLRVGHPSARGALLHGAGSNRTRRGTAMGVSSAQFPNYKHEHLSSAETYLFLHRPLLHRCVCFYGKQQHGCSRKASESENKRAIPDLQRASLTHTYSPSHFAYSSETYRLLYKDTPPTSLR